MVLPNCNQHISPRKSIQRLIFAICVLVFFTEWAQAEWVGSSACEGCHKEQYDSWVGSDHFKAMAVANESTVLGDFSGKTVTFNKVSHRFFTKNNKYYVETIGKSGKNETFSIPYTFGWFPLQQYLADIGDGHLQAMNVSWDSRPKKDGGQRWFHLQPEENMTPDNMFFWGAHVQNWNSRCAECHSTNLERNYDTESHSYDTSWSEINVACEACHGQGSKHIDLVNAKTYSNSNTGLAYASDAKSTGENHINMCGGCHSRRFGITDPNTFTDYNQKYRHQSIINGLYHPDGQIQDEVYVLGSFLQSKMHTAGVTCLNCHNPHSGKLIAEPQAVCAQCHAPETFDKPSHHLHAKSPAPLCVDCHMPETTYMGVDPRRDHSFAIPNPQASIDFGVPNACSNCHEEKGNKWAVTQLEKAGVKPQNEKWTSAFHEARNHNVLSVRTLSAIVQDQELPDIIRATALEHLGAFPSRVTLESAKYALKSPAPLVRRSAIESLIFVDPATRWTLLSPLLQDDVRFVRDEAAISLAGVLFDIPNDQRKILQTAIDQLKETLLFSADTPSSQLRIASLYTELGNYEKAEAAYRHALRISPTYVPALLNYAEYLRNTGHKDKELPLFEKAMAAMPESAAVHHAMGLHYIRNQQYSKAMPYLKTSSGGLLDARPRYAYVYAVALYDSGKKEDAINELIRSNEHWKNQYETLATLIYYLDEAGRAKDVYPYLSQISRIAPGSPQVKEWINKYK